MHKALAPCFALLLAGCGPHFEMVIEDVVVTRTGNDRLFISTKLRCTLVGADACEVSGGHCVEAVITDVLGEEIERAEKCTPQKLGEGQLLEISQTTAQVAPRPAKVTVTSTTSGGGTEDQLERTVTAP